MSTNNDVISFPELHDYDTAATFLSNSCPPSIKDDPELGLGSPESFACLLHRNLDLFKSIKNARTPERLSEIWRRCAKLARPLPVDPFLSHPEEVPLILNRIAPKITDLINGKAEPLLWTLDQSYPDSMSDIRKLDLRSLLEEERVPSMLFYELGSFKNKPDSNQRVRRLFHKGRDTFLVNASATGKTRLLYEGLCQHWGLYITAHSDAGEARALQLTLSDHIDLERDLVKYLPRASSLGFDIMLAKNREILFRRFSAVLLAHLYILRAFLTTACTQIGATDEVQKRRWLLTQLHTPLLDIEDPHTELLGAVELEPLSFIDEQLALVITDIKGLLPESVSTEGFFIAIDEANVAVRGIWFSEHGDTGPYPALEEIIRTWRARLASLQVPITFVVAGTRIPQEYFPNTSQEWFSWRWTSDTGSFDPETQKKFILPFLSLPLAESSQGQVLLKRIWDWCRPRYRLTTSYVVMLLKDKLIHPHGVLDRWIEGLTGFVASDAHEHTVAEGPCTIQPFFNKIGALVEDRPLVRSTTHEVIMSYIILGTHPPCYGINRVDIVNSGVGEFKDKDMIEISLDQPGPTIAAAVWLSAASHSREEPRSLTSFEDFCSYFHGRWPNGDTYTATSYVAFYLAHAFKDEGSHLLSDIFTVPSAPGWLDMNRKVSTRLVILQKDNHNVIKEFIVTTSALLPESPPLGYAASTPKDVIAWLRHERSGAFCLCPSGCGADLIFVLRHRGVFVWVLLRVAGQGSTTPLNTDKLYSEFEQLSIENLFPNDKSATELSDSLLSAFKALPNSPSCHLPLLRVVATFPSEPTLCRKRVKGSPVAVLKTSTFKEITETIPRQDLLRTVVLSMHGKRSSRYNATAFSPIKPLLSKERHSKRKTLETSIEAIEASPRNVSENENLSNASGMNLTPTEPGIKRAKGVRLRVAKS